MKLKAQCGVCTLIHNKSEKWKNFFPRYGKLSITGTENFPYLEWKILCPWYGKVQLLEQKTSHSWDRFFYVLIGKLSMARTKTILSLGWKFFRSWERHMSSFIGNLHTLCKEEEEEKVKAQPFFPLNAHNIHSVCHSSLLVQEKLILLS